MSMDKRKGSVYAWLGTVVIYVQRKKKSYPTMTNDGRTKIIIYKKRLNTYLSCGRRNLAIVNFLPKTFSNCNRFVASISKLFDRIVWKNLMSVEIFFFFVSNNKKRKQKKKIYTLVSENDKNDIQPRNSR